MPPPIILDPAEIDFSRVVADRNEIMRLNPHRHEFQLLDGVILCDEEEKVLAGYHEVCADAWWARGHIPGRPLFPGVLMIEVGAQLASFMYQRYFHDGRFLGFVGIDRVKFREIVQPPCRYVVVARARQLRPRRVISEIQGFVGPAMVFEGRITGMPV